MNKERRKALNAIRAQLDALPLIEDLVSQMQELLDEEQSCYDAMPEGFQNGDKGEKAQAAIDAMQEAIDAFDGFDDAVVNATQALETAAA